jgi:hypothetical protein
MRYVPQVFENCDMHAKRRSRLRGNAARAFLAKPRCAIMALDSTRT